MAREAIFVIGLFVTSIGDTYSLSRDFLPTTRQLNLPDRTEGLQVSTNGMEVRHDSEEDFISRSAELERHDDELQLDATGQLSPKDGTEGGLHKKMSGTEVRSASSLDSEVDENQLLRSMGLRGAMYRKLDKNGNELQENVQDAKVYLSLANEKVKKALVKARESNQDLVRVMASTDQYGKNVWPNENGQKDWQRSISSEEYNNQNDCTQRNFERYKKPKWVIVNGKYYPRVRPKRPRSNIRSSVDLENDGETFDGTQETADNLLKIVRNTRSSLSNIIQGIMRSLIRSVNVLPEDSMDSLDTNAEVRRNRSPLESDSENILPKKMNSDNDGNGNDADIDDSFLPGQY